MRYVAALACLLFAVTCAQASQVCDLRTDYLWNPIGIDSRLPSFSWQFRSDTRGACQTAYQVQVGTQYGGADMWDSGKVVSGRSVGVPYDGKPLKGRTNYYWWVRVWDEKDVASDFSGPEEFETGLLNQSDWSAKWISGPSSGGNGYHSQYGASVDDAKWVQIDLGKPRAFQAVVLYPARPFNWQRDEPGFGFPVRYRVEASDDADFRSARVIADRTKEDQPNPRENAVAISVGDQAARYIRITATKLDQPRGTKPLFALVEMEVLDASGQNIGINAQVEAKDSVEDHGWGKGQLTDGCRESKTPGAISPLLRKEFTLSKPVLGATAYVTGVGYYEFHINGEKYEYHSALEPARTEYSKRVAYSTYPLGDILKQGRNCVGAMLGQGWWSKAPRLLVQIEIEYRDGTKERIVSDESWKWSNGPILENSIYNGETYDARLEQNGWDKPEFDDSAWLPVSVVDWNVQLSAQMIEPMLPSLMPRAKSITSPKPGVYVVDFGQNFSGWCRLKIGAPAGTKITLKHAELLYPDGTVNQENLRSARATDTYITRGVGIESYMPRFTYHGFRYVQVEGYPGRLTPDKIEGVFVATELRPRGTFSCSNELINQVQKNSVWGMRTNFHSIPTDCPQRDERQGWMGDAWMTSDAMLFNLDMPAAYSWFLRDIADSQREDGAVPDTVPQVWGTQPGDPMWSAAYPMIAWNTYVHTGDKAILARHYNGIKRSVDLLAREAKDYIVTRNNYGDWIAVEGTPKDLISTGTFCWLSGVVADMADALGKADDGRAYRELRAKVGDAFNKTFLDQSTGSYGNGSQFSNAFPLYLGIVPADKREQVLANLIESVEVKHKGHLSTGFIGTPFLLDALVQAGRADVAYRIVTQEDYPGWGYMIKNGATTIWELWELKTGNGMNSHNHPALGFVSAWFYRILAGISPDPKHPGWERFSVKPYVLGDMKTASATVNTVRGKVASDWKLTGKGIRLSVTVPANSTARVCLPKLGREDCTITEGKSVIWKSNSFRPADGILAARVDRDWIEFHVLSGRYVFELEGK